MTTRTAIPKLTLDTSVVFRLLEHRPQDPRLAFVEQLMALATGGEVDLAVTARIREDIPNEPLASRLNELSILGVSETLVVGRWGVSRWGEFIWGSSDFGGYYDTACELARQRGKNPPDWRDWDHLHSHLLQGRDYFLTWDQGILCLAQQLLEKFGVVVLTPEAALLKLDKQSTV